MIRFSDVKKKALIKHAGNVTVSTSVLWHHTLYMREKIPPTVRSGQQSQRSRSQFYLPTLGKDQIDNIAISIVKRVYFLLPFLKLK